MLLSACSLSHLEALIFLLCDNADSDRSRKNVDITEAHYDLLAFVVITQYGENVGVAVLDNADISDDPLTAAIRLADDPLPPEFFELLPASRQIRTDNHYMPP